MSRETVACTASIPRSRRASASSACVRGTARWTSRRIAPWRSYFVSRQHLPEDRRRPVDLVSEIVSGGVRRSAVSPAVPTSRPCSSAAGATGAGGAVELDARAGGRRRAPRRAAASKRSRSPARGRAGRRRSRRRPRRPPRTRRGCRRRSTRGRRGRTRRRRVGDEQRADRQAVCEPLRERDRVRLHAGALPGEELAGAADAGLHLVEDEQRVVLVGERAGLLERPAASGLTPPSPWTGSRMIAAVVGADARPRASRASRSAHPGRAARTAPAWPAGR